MKNKSAQMPHHRTQPEMKALKYLEHIDLKEAEVVINILEQGAKQL